MGSPTASSISSSESGAARIQARRSLLLLAAMLVVAQPLSALAGRHYLASWGSAGNPYNQWSAYADGPAPEVLYLGDSRVREDVDADEIARVLSAASPGSRPVASIGIDAAKPTFLRAVAEQVRSMPRPPRVVVLAVSDFQLNASWDRSGDSGGSQTNYFWQLGSPFDPGYAATALNMDDERGRLLAGWAVPLLANYPVIVSGARCDLSAFRGQITCVDEYRDRSRVMDDDALARWRRIIAEQYLGNFAASDRQIGAMESTIRDLKESGVAVRVVVLPVYRVEEIDAVAFKTYMSAVEVLASSSGVELTDLHSLFDATPAYFADPNHLNARGSKAIAPYLAGIVKGSAP